MRIIISPYSQKLRGKLTENPKNYPWWPELIQLLQGNELIQVGVGDEPRLIGCAHEFNLSYPKLKELLLSCDLFFSVDNFFPHFAHHYGKHGVVLWGPSNPEIFGYSQNLNLYKDKSYFRPDQFGLWESCERIEEAFVSPTKVFEAFSSI